MTNKTVKITRWTRLGWDYNVSPTQTEQGYRIDPPTKPYHTGTYKQVLEAIEDDVSFQYIGSSSYYNSAWFVRVKGQWYRIVGDEDGFMRDFWRDDLACDGKAVVQVEKVQ